ncbi:hypothetical protein [Niastella populi]|uniref:hypothetical protein n=1 Tax=Niastella populi TaxID=550983 RepID=UPI0013FE01A3|nr:hypothetical protein [Niastella populi]
MEAVASLFKKLLAANDAAMLFYNPDAQYLSPKKTIRVGTTELVMEISSEYC